MKISTFLACGYLILLGVFTTVYALSGFSVLLFLCAGNTVLYRALLAPAAVFAAWLFFWLVAFRPTRFVS